jgi:type II secretory ATPase GspE/PulE/Tfp pilus assembly ATPase PilB-like protein
LALGEKQSLAQTLQKEVDKNQRSLARKYGISFGLVNKLINMEFTNNTSDIHLDMRKDR